MSFLSGLLCGCFAPKASPRPPSAPVQAMAGTHPHSHHHFPYPNDQPESPGYSSGPDEDGYTTPVPLPRYTPRPLSSAQEKTLEAHLRDPPLSSSRDSTTPLSVWDEKDPRDFASHDAGAADADELASDTSSAISFPSSYGNTSTATRETPPPPYSPRTSPAPSRAMSISSLNPPPLPPPPPLAYLAQPRPVVRRADCLVRDFGAHGRVSFEDQRSVRSRRLSWESR